MTQKDGESVDQFASRLRMQAKHCSFQDEDDQLRDQLIEHIRDARLRRKLLETATIKLADVLKTAHVWESVDQQAKGMQHAIASAPVASASDIAAVRPLKSLPKVKISSHNDLVCTHCGRPGHYARSESCPARGRTCSKCHKRNHFSSQCRSHGAPAPFTGSSQRRNSGHAADRRPQLPLQSMKGRRRNRLHF